MSFQMFTRKEAAKQARISPRFLDMQIKAGCGPDVTRIGRRVLVRADKFADWIEKLTAESQRTDASTVGHGEDAICAADGGHLDAAR